MIKVLNNIKKPKVSELGGKGHSLSVLINNGFNVPKGVVITSEAFFKFLKFNNLMKRIENLSSEINENNFQEKTKKIRDLIFKGQIPKDIVSEVKDCLNDLSVEYVSIRSSAVSEDSLKSSFAGLHDTFLNIKSESDFVLDYIKKCWVSLFNERSVFYRIRKEIPHLEGMGVVIQEMIPSEVSGITFTVHPTDKKAILIEVSYGIGNLIVSGEIVPDSFTIDRESLKILEKRISNKNKMSICSGAGIKTIDIGEEIAKSQAISDDKTKEIAELCLEIEKIFQNPQDIEWCSLNNKIWLVQSRAITTLKISLKKTPREKIILKGIAASPGIAQGMVKLVLSPLEASKMKDGNILVTVMTNPLYVVAIQKAKAIVTDVGGMICHAAIVARELGIPCVVGAEKATEILKDDMEVFVDGTKGTVYLSD